jgi:hypothetical protein
MEKIITPANARGRRKRYQTQVGLILRIIFLGDSWQRKLIIFACPIVTHEVSFGVL